MGCAVLPAEIPAEKGPNLPVTGTGKPLQRCLGLHRAVSTARAAPLSAGSRSPWGRWGQLRSAQPEAWG